MTFIQSVQSNLDIYIFQSYNEVLTKLYWSDQIDFFEGRYEFLDENLKDKKKCIDS
jgi:hypothetical protein